MPVQPTYPGVYIRKFQVVRTITGLRLPLRRF